MTVYYIPQHNIVIYHVNSDDLMIVDIDDDTFYKSNASNITSLYQKTAKVIGKNGDNLNYVLYAYCCVYAESSDIRTSDAISEMLERILGSDERKKLVHAICQYMI